MNNKSHSVNLCNNKTECCGCGVCSVVCPKSAINMIEDEYGFIYPRINKDKCVGCNLCVESCSFQKDIEMKFPVRAYAAVNKSDSDLVKSSSGGVFSVFAKEILKNNGIVYGASLYYHNEKLNIRHIRISDVMEIPLIQDSKYVQSSTAEIFQKVKNDLESDTNVLFTGTPCQIASLKAYLKKEYVNLFTVEIICHGVPSEKMFQDYIYSIECNKNIKINDYKFRYKNKGQGISSYISFTDNINKIRKNKVVNGKEESYVYLFLKSYIYRDCCYSCKYARNERCSDITIGDYWGFISEHPDADNSIYTNEKGISCLIVNTEKGTRKLKEVQEQMYLLNTDFYSVAKHNKQLTSPSIKPENRKEILDIYKKNGYSGVDRYFRKNFKKDIFIEKIKYMVPKSFKRKITKAMALLK